MPLSGHTFGDYQLLRRIGHGATASVYEAYQTSKQRFVALKVLPPVFAQQAGDYAERFAQEITVSIDIDHPNIIKVLDYGIDDDYSFIVMALLRGGTLRERMKLATAERINPPTVTDVLEITKKIGRALNHVHQQDIVHRDVKPNNIMFDENGVPMLVDFGIARLIDSTSITGTGLPVGTPYYMAPEQWMAEDEVVSPSSDQYALAAMTFQLLTGQPLYAGESPFILMNAHLHADVPNICERQPDLPLGLNPIMQQALAKDPDARFPSIGQFVDAVATILGDESSEITDFTLVQIDDAFATEPPPPPPARQILADAYASWIDHADTPRDATVTYSAESESRWFQWISTCLLVLVVLVILAGGWLAITAN